MIADWSEADRLARPDIRLTSVGHSSGECFVTEGRVWHSRQRETNNLRPVARSFALAWSGRAFAIKAGVIAGGGAKFAQLTINRVMIADTTRPTQRLRCAKVVAAAGGRGPGWATSATGLAERGRARWPRLQALVFTSWSRRWGALDNEVRLRCGWFEQGR